MAVALTPTAHYTRTAAPNGTDQTWCGWFRLDAVPNPSGFNAVLAQDAGAPDWMGLYLDEAGGLGQLNVWNNDNGTPVITGPSYAADSAWHFAAVVRQGTSWTLYYRNEDWELLESETGTGTGVIGTNLRLGAEFVLEAATALNGALAYWRVFESALTEAQLFDESNSQVALAAEWADWPIAAVASQTDDISGNNRPLTATAGSGSFTDTGGPEVIGPPAVQGSGLLAGGGSLDLGGARSRTTSGSLDGGGTLALSGSRSKTGPFPLDGGGSLALEGSITTPGELSVDGGGELALSGTRSKGAPFALDGGGTFTVAGSEIVPGSGSLDGGGELTMSGTRRKPGTAGLDGGGVLMLAGTITEPGTGVLDGGGALAMAGSRAKRGTMALEGSATLELAGDAPTGDASGCDRIPIPPTCRPVRARVGESALRVACADAPRTPGSAGLDIACNN